MEALERAVDALSAIKAGRALIDDEATDLLVKQAASLETLYGLRIEILPVASSGYALSLAGGTAIQGLTEDQVRSVLTAIAMMLERQNHAAEELNG